MGRGLVTIAGIQFAGIAEEKQRNTESATRLIRQASAAGAQIVMTPEVVLTGFVGGEREREMAEPIPGPSCAYFAALARSGCRWSTVPRPRATATACLSTQLA